MARWPRRLVLACASGSPAFFFGSSAAKRDPDFVEVVRRHVRIPGHLNT
jgi:hypothetical protein